MGVGGMGVAMSGRTRAADEFPTIALRRLQIALQRRKTEAPKLCGCTIGRDEGGPYIDASSCAVHYTPTPVSAAAGLRIDRRRP